MDRLVRNMLLACSALMFILTSCFRDGLEPCGDDRYYSYIRFEYKENLENEERFHTQVGKIDVFLFDKDGIYMEVLSHSASGGSTFPRDFVMGVPEEYKNVDQFVAFGGLYEGHYSVSNMTVGQSTLSDLLVSVRSSNTAGNIVDYELSPFFYGKVTQESKSVERNDTTLIPLVKNSNDFRVMLKEIDTDVDIEVYDFLISLRSRNGVYNHNNEVPSGSDYWYYLPYDNSMSTVAPLNTLRLIEGVAGSTITLSITTPAGVTTDVDMIEEIRRMRSNDPNHSSMPLQEYMNKRDDYEVTVYLERSDDGSGSWIYNSISVNEWITRDQDI